MSNKLIFLDVFQGHQKVQAMLSQCRFLDIQNFHHSSDLLKNGDIFRVTGNPGKTKAGELSLFANNCQIIGKSYKEIPWMTGLSEVQCE